MLKQSHILIYLKLQSETDYFCFWQTECISPAPIFRQNYKEATRSLADAGEKSSYFHLLLGKPNKYSKLILRRTESWKREED